jgi:hypothetical protein
MGGVLWNVIGHKFQPQGLERNKSIRDAKEKAK